MVRCSSGLDRQDALRTGPLPAELLASASATPQIVARLAGLPAAVLGPLASPSCLELAAERNEISLRLARERKALVEAIASHLSLFDPEARRYLLAVKRAAYNGRSLCAFAAAPQWRHLEVFAPGSGARIGELESRLLAAERSFSILYPRELDRERRHLAFQAEDRRFLRGVALGRPGLAEKVRAKAPALAAAPGAGGPAKWERSFLRFVTRAASKLSTNSTLTVCAFGRLHRASEPPLLFDTLPQREISLVRAQRPELEQLLSLLLAIPAVRERCRVAWNDTVEEPEPGRFLYLREEHYVFDEETGDFRHVAKARVAVRLTNPAIAGARHLLAAEPLGFPDLLAALERLAGGGEPVDTRNALDQLLRLGILLLLPPWPSHEPRLEQRLLRFLRTIPEDPSLSPVLAALEELVDLERNFAVTPVPEKSVRRIGECFAAIATAARLRGDGDAPPSPPQAIRLFEEVLLVSSGAAAAPAILSISAASAAEILGVAGLVSEYASLFHRRHDLLHTLGEWWRRHEPERASLPFTDLGQRFAPLWKDFLDFLDRSRDSADSTFDPLGSPWLLDLGERRRRLLSDYAGLLAASPGQSRLERDALAQLVASVPPRYGPLLGVSAFVQPADSACKTWVFNNLHQGTGRFFSRLTPAMEGELESSFLDHLTARSRVSVDGEEAELIEVKYPFGHLVRAHHPQTTRVFDWRGVNLDLPPERRLSLRDLRVVADLEADRFRLVDRMGRRLLPLHVSTLNEEMLPNLLRLLLAFGPGDIRNVFPTSHVERGGDDGTVHLRRLSCGSVVLRRQAWALDLAALRARLGALPGAAAHLELDAWRRGLGLPLRVFYYESIRHGVTGGLKPQYLDFSSPSLVQLFAESVRRPEQPRMMVEEALPSPDEFPLDHQGRRRGLELLIDSLMLSRAEPSPATEALQ